MLTFGSIMNGAFRHFRERPLAILIWGVTYIVGSIVSSLLMIPVAGFMASRFADMHGASPMAMVGILGMLLPFYAGLILLALVLVAASLRTLLQPGEEKFAGLRVGWDELRLFGLFVILFIGFLVVGFGGGLLVGLIGTLLSAATGGGGLGGLLVFLLMLAFVCTMIFLMVRLSLVSALTILRRRIVISESWSLTRGHFWQLFGAYFVLGVMQFIFFAIVFGITLGPVFAQMFSQGFSPGNVAANQAQMQNQFGAFGLTSILMILFSGAAVAVSHAVWGGSVATAVLDLTGLPDDHLAETFA